MIALVEAIKQSEIGRVSWQPWNGTESCEQVLGLEYANKLQDHEIVSWARLTRSGVSEWLQRTGRSDAFFFLASATDWPD